MFRKFLPHSCHICASFVFSVGSYPASGQLHHIGDYGQEVFLFDLDFGEASIGARRGCLFMSWVVSLSGAGYGSRLRAAFSLHGHGITNIYFEWVQKADDSVLGGVPPLTLCANERYDAQNASTLINRFLTVCLR